MNNKYLFSGTHYLHAKVFRIDKLDLFVIFFLKILVHHFLLMKTVLTIFNCFFLNEKKNNFV